MEKINSIQALRGLAALMVLFHHFMQQFYEFQVTNFVGDFFSFQGHFGVDIFFVISGFIMAYTLMSKFSSAKKFFINRLIRIIPAYYFYTLVFIILGSYSDLFSSSSAEIETIIKSLLFIPHENPDESLGVYPTLTVGWTLNIEMFFYLILSLLLIIKLKMLKRLLLVALIFLLLPLLVRVCEIEFYKDVIGNLRMVEFSLGIILGIVYKKYNTLLVNRWLMFFSVVSLMSYWVIPVPNVLKDIYLASLIVYVFLFLNRYFQNEGVIKRIFMYLGEISYSLYLSHSIIISIFWILVPKPDEIGILTIVLLGIVVLTILISHISYKYVEIKFSRFIIEKIYLKSSLPIKSDSSVHG